MKVIEALETGIAIEGPAGKVTVDPKTHHCILDVHVIEVKDQKMNVVKSLSQVPPKDTQSVCDLKANPNEIGRASCRARVCQYVEISVVAVSVKKKIKKRTTSHKPYRRRPEPRTSKTKHKKS